MLGAIYIIFILGTKESFLDEGPAQSSVVKGREPQISESKNLCSVFEAY